MNYFPIWENSLSVTLTVAWRMITLVRKDHLLKWSGQIYIKICHKMIQYDSLVGKNTKLEERTLQKLAVKIKRSLLQTVKLKP